MEPAIIVHGGAGDIPPELHEAHQQGVRRAVEAGWDAAGDRRIGHGCRGDGHRHHGRRRGIRRRAGFLPERRWPGRAGCRLHGRRRVAGWRGGKRAVHTESHPAGPCGDGKERTRAAGRPGSTALRTQDGLLLVRSHRPGSPPRIRAMAEAALRPDLIERGRHPLLHRTRWAAWPSIGPGTSPPAPPPAAHPTRCPVAWAMCRWWAAGSTPTTSSVVPRPPAGERASPRCSWRDWHCTTSSNWAIPGPPPRQPSRCSLRE